jgi:hypothetical protein
VKRYFSGFAGTVVFGATAYFSYIVAQGLYYSYIVWPKEKADEHYIVPTRWQDLAFLVVFWVVSLLLFFISFRLIRFALKDRAVPQSLSSLLFSFNRLNGGKSEK